MVLDHTTINNNDILSILDNMTTAVLLTDNQQNVLNMNAAAEVFFRVSINNASQFNLDTIQVNDSRRFSDLISETIEPEAGYTYRELKMLVNGKTHYADCSVRCLPEGHKYHLLIEITKIDRILRISKEENLIRQHITAKEIARGLAHEINNPLGGIRGAAQLLEREANDPELAQFTKIIISESDRLQNLMKRMLGPSTRLDIQQINIHEALQRVVKLFKAEFGDEITFKLDYDPSIPLLNADQEQLIQAILNIVRNAIQATEGKGIITLQTRPVCSYTIGNTFYKLVLMVKIIDTLWLPGDLKAQDLAFLLRNLS